MAGSGSNRRGEPKGLGSRPDRTALTDERRTAARRLFEETAVTGDLIARTFGVHHRTVRNTALRENWTRGTIEAVGPDGLGGACPGVDLCPVRQKAQRRLYATLERRLGEAEEQTFDTAADRERAVRALSSLTRTLDKLIDMDRQAGEALRGAALRPQAGGAHGADGTSQAGEEAPYDVDGLRRALSRRLEGLVGDGPPA